MSFTLRFSIVLTLFTLAAGMAHAQQARAPSEPPPAPVATAPAETVRISPQQWSPGSVLSRHDARLASELAGRVTGLAQVGSTLRRGQEVGRLDDRMLRLQERENLATIRRIEARLAYSRSQEQRFAELERQQSLSRSQLEQGRADVQVLEQELESARVALAQTRHWLSTTAVRAPFDGVVVERFTDIGEYLAVGAPLLRLVSTRELEVSARAPLALAPRLKVGQQVAVRAGEQTLQARLRSVVPVGNQASRQLEVRVELPNGQWPIGSAVQVALPSASPRSVVAVPRDAIVLRKEGAYVVVVGRDNRTRRVGVRTGASHGRLVEINGAIAAGDRLVVRGAERLQPGQRVQNAGASSARTVFGSPG